MKISIDIPDRHIENAITAGIESGVRYWCPTRFAEVLADKSDANTGDVLIQLACFGELRYG